MLDRGLVHQEIILYGLTGSGIEYFLLQLSMNFQLFTDLLRQFFLGVRFVLLDQFFVFLELLFNLVVIIAQQLDRVFGLAPACSASSRRGFMGGGVGCWHMASNEMMG